MRCWPQRHGAGAIGRARVRVRRNRKDHEGSIHTDGDSLVTWPYSLRSATPKSSSVFPTMRSGRVVNMMIGGADDAAEMGAMQLSIVSETVSQIAVAMTEAARQRSGCFGRRDQSRAVHGRHRPAAPAVRIVRRHVHVSADTAPQIANRFCRHNALEVAETACGAAPKPAPRAARRSRRPSRKTQTKTAAPPPLRLRQARRRFICADDPDADARRNPARLTSIWFTTFRCKSAPCSDKPHCRCATSSRFCRQRIRTGQEFNGSHRPLRQ